MELWVGGGGRKDGRLVRHGLFKFELYCKISLVLAGSWFCGCKDQVRSRGFRRRNTEIGHTAGEL